MRERVKFCDDNKYRGDIEKVKVKSTNDEVKIEHFAMNMKVEMNLKK